MLRSSLIESQKLWKIIFHISYQYFVNLFFFFHIKLLVHAIFSLWMRIHYRLMNSVCFKDAWPNFSNQFFIIVYVYVSFAVYISFSIFIDGLIIFRFLIYQTFSKWHDGIQIRIYRNVTVTKLNQIVQLEWN